MNRRLRILLAIGGILAILALTRYVWGFAQAQTPERSVTKTGHYQLDTGAFVTWWIDEDRALLCEALSDALSNYAGLTCLPLSSTVYAWPAQP